MGENMITINPNVDLKTFENLYRLTFERQNISPPSSQIEIIKKVAAQVMISDCGFIIAARSPAGAVASVMLILIDCKCGYNLVMANNPEFRDLGANTRLVIEAIERCQRLGIREFDFVGINSLQRGDFKLSFSAKPKQYIEATWARPNVQ
jgi:lipid II:glycine glycyltransferase (peptidoglycan interpeptide bridge formation enzyme)